MDGEFLQSLLQTLIEVLLPVLLGFLVWGVKEAIAWVKANVAQRKLEVAISLATQLVMAAEQSGLAGYIKDESIEKRDWVLKRLEAALAERGIKLNVEELYAFVEAQVWEAFTQYKDELGWDDLVNTEAPTAP